MAALPLLPMVAVVALKVAVVALAATVTDAGTVRVELVFDRLTLALPLGTAGVRVTVQVVEEVGPRLPGLHVREDIDTATRLTAVLAELLL
jgi:hypothetical protein